MLITRSRQSALPNSRTGGSGKVDESPEYSERRFLARQKAHGKVKENQPGRTLASPVFSYSPCRALKYIDSFLRLSILISLSLSSHFLSSLKSRLTTSKSCVTFFYFFCYSLENYEGDLALPSLFVFCTSKIEYFAGRKTTRWIQSFCLPR